jgi:hypothetical protein
MPEDEEDAGFSEEEIEQWAEEHLDGDEAFDEPVVTDDIEDALGGEQSWQIKTGKHQNGRPVALKVKVKDPGDQSLLTSYISSQDKEAAAKSLWKACVVEPQGLWKRYDDVTTAFKLNLTQKVLSMLGFNSDFLATMQDLVPETATSRPSRSGTESPPSTDSTPDGLGGLGSAGQLRPSEMPSATPDTSDKSDEKKKSKTSGTSTETSGQTTESNTPDKTSNESNETLKIE